MPTAVVADKVGAVVVPVPPVAWVYHTAVLPADTVAESVSAVPKHTEGLVAVGADGRATTVTVTRVRWLSHSVVGFFWLTQYDVVPRVAVDGVGAVEDAVPPVAAVCQSRSKVLGLAVAVRAVAVSPMQ